jgi:hypothetical protein
LSPFSFPGNNKTHFGFHVKCPILLSDINQIWISRQIFIKELGIKFHGNPSSGNGVDTCGQMDGQTEMTTLLEVFHYHSNARKNVRRAQIYLFMVYLRNLSIHRRVMLVYPVTYCRCFRTVRWINRFKLKGEPILTFPFTLHHQTCRRKETARSNKITANN